MNAAAGLLRTARPGQWAKNLFVFAPLLFARHWAADERTADVLVAFVLFCLAASAVYFLNDTLDRERDRAHPRKRSRPLARGDVSPALALSTAAVCAAVAVAGALFWLGDTAVVHVLVLYLAIQVVYSWRVKHVVVLDVMSIASGFVLRLLAGGFAGDVPQSHWILVCTVFVSLLLALCKRRSEVVSLGADAADHRAILADYPPALLDQLISAATAGSLVTYALYSVDASTVARHGVISGTTLPVMVLTLPFVVYGVFRYLYLVYRRGGGGSPTSTLVRDVPSIANALAYLVATWLAFRVAVAA